VSVLYTFKKNKTALDPLFGKGVTAKTRMNMNKKLVILLLSGWMLVGIGLETEARAAASPEVAIAKSEMGLFGKNKKKKRKKYKGYKKPRNKKFLGIFKRKSDCGCLGT